MKTILNFKKAPYGLLLFAAIVLLIALVVPPIVNIDFQNMTMFSVPLTTMVWMIPLFLLTLWLIYLMTRRFLYSVTITWVHVLITVCTTMFIMIVMYIGIVPSQSISEGQLELIGNAMQILFLLLVCGQFTYLLNVVLGIFIRQKSQ